MGPKYIRLCEVCSGKGRLIVYPWNGSKPTTDVICQKCMGKGRVNES